MNKILNNINKATNFEIVQSATIKDKDCLIEVQDNRTGFTERVFLIDGIIYFRTFSVRKENSIVIISKKDFNKNYTILKIVYENLFIKDKEKANEVLTKINNLLRDNIHPIDICKSIISDYNLKISANTLYNYYAYFTSVAEDYYIEEYNKLSDIKKSMIPHTLKVTSLYKDKVCRNGFKSSQIEIDNNIFKYDIILTMMIVCIFIENDADFNKSCEDFIKLSIKNTINIQPIK